LPTIRSEYSFDQFEKVLQKLAHEIAVEAVTKLEHGSVRIEISSNRFRRVETDKHTISFYADHIGFSRMTSRDYWGFDVEEKEYTSSNHRTKISYVIMVEGKFVEDKYVEVGRAEKEHKRATEILEFIEKLMAENQIKPVPRFSLRQASEGLLCGPTHK
jgi:hypothetical protein